jgi:hypothetical protein
MSLSGVKQTSMAARSMALELYDNIAAIEAWRGAARAATQTVCASDFGDAPLARKPEFLSP